MSLTLCGQRDEVPVSFVRGDRLLRRFIPICQLTDSMHHTQRDRLGARWTNTAVFPSLLGSKAYIALAMAVKMVLSFFGKELDGPPISVAGLKRLAHGEVIELRVKHAALAAQFGRRVGVGIGHQRVSIQIGKSPVHRWIRGQARFYRKDLRGQIAVALLHRVKARLGTQHRKPRRPNMGRDQVTSFTTLDGQLQQVTTVEPQNRTTIGGYIADSVQTLSKTLSLLEIRHIDQVMDFTGPICLLVDGRDLDLQHEPDRIAAPADPRVHFSLQIGAKPKQTGLGFYKFLLSLREPRGMREITAGNDGDTLLASPTGKVLQITFAAGGPRILRMDVQVRVEGHDNASVHMID
jgi:hypothetical protein